MRRPLPVLLVAAVGLTAALGAPALAAPTALPAPASESAAEAVPGELLVGYVPTASETDKSRARGRAGAARQEQVVEAAVDVERVLLPAGKDRREAEAELESDPAVAYAEPNWVLQHAGKPTPAPAPAAGSGDPYFTDGSLWGLYGDASTPANAFGSQAAEAWAADRTGSDTVYVGVIDEGIQVTHPDLDGNVWTNPVDSTFDGVDQDGNGFVDDVHGWDFVNDDSSVYDGGTRGSLDDHGTHVAGTIGAEADGAGVVGVNHAVTMISGKFLGRRGGSLADAVRALDYFTALKNSGLNIVATNNSWGGGGFSQTLLDAIRRSDAAGILFVAAAGNNGTDNDATPSYPSGYDVPNVLAVAAIDKTGALASFSQYGATTVDLGAPGVGVWSTTAFNGWSSYNGTSMATPHVTGAAALYAASRSGASAATIKQAILSSTVATPSLLGKTATGGRLDASGF